MFRTLHTYLVQTSDDCCKRNCDICECNVRTASTMWNNQTALPRPPVNQQGMVCFTWSMISSFASVRADIVIVSIASWQDRHMGCCWHDLSRLIDMPTGCTRARTQGHLSMRLCEISPSCGHSLAHFETRSGSPALLLLQWPQQPCDLIPLIHHLIYPGKFRMGLSGKTSTLGGSAMPRT